MILETHGDVNRLGYFRIVPYLFPKDGEVSMKFLVNILDEKIKSIPNSESVNPKNCLKVAKGLGLIELNPERNTWKLGMFGKFYLWLNHPDDINDILAKNPLTLSPLDKIFFFRVICERDHPFFEKIFIWVVKKKEFQREEAMNEIMEEIYPECLLEILTKEENSENKLKIEKKIEKSKHYRERRLSISKTSWIRDSQYHFYRHTVPPRLEWMCDLEILIKIKKGKYSLNPKIKENSKEILKFLEEKGALNFAFELAKMIFPGIRKASRYEMIRAIVEAYQNYALFNNELYPSIPPETLATATEFLLLKKNTYASRQEIHNTLNLLCIKFHDKIYPAEGGRIRMTLKEEDL